ncbi:MAG: nicotinate (nicotinamide) nucleotide adenylyltransferase [Salinivirgaceae bacterium]|jgi:nicotinate-nucleotide adenylyltransferase|nr:nicotinate (nicotinamide) nucleotide adenylyltransferase [Salinivirgaceae bacterium]
MKKEIEKVTGLYFGSFNPIHIGHLAIANYIVEYTALEELWFVVSPQSPFKKKASLLNNYERLELVHKAIGTDVRFRASDIEFRLPQPSYTIDTLTYLSEKFPGRRFAIIIGADNLFYFHKWKNYKQILSQYSLYVYPRPGFSREECPKLDSISWVEAPVMEISSSFLRSAIREGRNMQHFVPTAAWSYIDEMGFYQD